MQKERSRGGVPFSIRFTEDEKLRLKELARDVPMGSFIRNTVLAGEIAARSQRKAPIRDGNALGQVLALLGQSRIANNLNQLAKAANLGALPVTKETEADIRLACAGVAEMRRYLLAALGISVIEEATTSAAGAFARASRGDPS